MGDSRGSRAGRLAAAVGLFVCGAALGAAGSAAWRPAGRHAVGSTPSTAPPSATSTQSPAAHRPASSRLDRDALADGAGARLGPPAGAIRGRVIDATGRGVGGVVVRLTSPAWDGEAITQPEVLLERARIQALHDIATRREAVADAEGRFAWSDLPAVEYTIALDAPGWRLRDRPTWIRPPAELVLRAVAGARVPVDVRFSDGTPAAAAWIGEGDGIGSQTWTPTAAELELDAGTHRLTARVKVDEERTATSQVVEVVVGNDGRAVPDRLVFRVPRPAGVRVRVDAPPEALADVGVWLVRRPAGVPVDVVARGEGVALAQESAGMFVARHALPGVYLAVAGRGEWQPEVLGFAEVEVVEGAVVEVAVDLAAKAPVDGVYVRVQGPDGQPLARAVELGLMTTPRDRDPTDLPREGDGAPDWVSSRTVAVPGGGLLLVPNQGDLAGIEAAAAERGRVLLVTARAAGLGAAPLARVDGRTATVAFVAPATVEVCVRGPGVEAFGGDRRLRVQLCREGHPYDVGEDWLGDPACAVIAGLTPGRYQVNVSHRTDRLHTEGPFLLASGANRIDVTLPALHPLRVRVPGAAGPVSVHVQTSTDGRINGLLPAGAEEVEMMVPAGTHVVSAWQQQPLARAVAEVAVAGPTNLELVLGDRRGLHVDLVRDRARVLLSPTGLRGGDILVRVGPIAIVDRATCRAAWSLTLGEPESDFAVHRDDGFVDLRGPLGPALVALALAGEVEGTLELVSDEGE